MGLFLSPFITIFMILGRKTVTYGRIVLKVLGPLSSLTPLYLSDFWAGGSLEQYISSLLVKRIWKYRRDRAILIQIQLHWLTLA